MVWSCHWKDRLGCSKNIRRAMCISVLSSPCFSTNLISLIRNDSYNIKSYTMVCFDNTHSVFCFVQYYSVVHPLINKQKEEKDKKRGQRKEEGVRRREEGRGRRKRRKRRSNKKKEKYIHMVDYYYPLIRWGTLIIILSL